MWGQLIGAGLGALGGSKGQKGGGGTPKYVKRQIKRGMTAVNDATARPVGEAISPLNADQNRAFDMIRGNVGLGAGDVQSAIDTARRASGGVTAGDISQFYNPYEDTVVGNTIRDITRARDMNLLQIGNDAEAAKAFGGDREAVAKALASEDFNRNLATTVGGLRFGGYNSALDAAFRNNATLLAGSQGLLDAVGAQRGNAYQDAGAVLGVGDTVRSYDQSLLDYPLKMAQMQLDAGTAAMGATRQGATTGGGISGAMAGAAGGYDLFGKLFGG
jgi:hypothetical protein